MKAKVGSILCRSVHTWYINIFIIIIIIMYRYFYVQPYGLFVGNKFYQS